MASYDDWKLQSPPRFEDGPNADEEDEGQEQTEEEYEQRPELDERDPDLAWKERPDETAPGLSYYATTKVSYPPDHPEAGRPCGYLVEEIRCSYPTSRTAKSLAEAVEQWLELGTGRAELRALAGANEEFYTTWQRGQWSAWQ